MRIIAALALAIVASPAAAERLSFPDCIEVLAQAYAFRTDLVEGYMASGGGSRNSPEAAAALLIAVNRFLPVIRDLGDACELIRQEDLEAWETLGD